MANTSADDFYMVEGSKMNLIETLIREVEASPALWNKYDNNYNRTCMDTEWRRIATLLGKEKNFIKHKWRNLRDQFLRESKKVKVPFDNPTKPYIEYYRGKWIYFEKMLFLRKAPPTNITLVDCDYPEELEVYDDSIVKEEGEEFEENTLIANNMFSVDHSNFNGSTPIHSLCISNDNTLIINPKDEIVNKINNEEKEPDVNIISSRKRKCSDSSESVVSEKSKRQSVDGYSSSNDQNEIDDDLHFLKSLVPFLKKLPPIRKLLVRNEIQNLLIRESLCDKCKGNTSDMC